MSFFKIGSDVESLDELGVSYEEVEPTAPSHPSRRRRPLPGMAPGSGGDPAGTGPPPASSDLDMGGVLAPTSGMATAAAMTAAASSSSPADGHGADLVAMASPAVAGGSGLAPATVRGGGSRSAASPTAASVTTMRNGSSSLSPHSSEHSQRRGRLPVNSTAPALEDSSETTTDYNDDHSRSHLPPSWRRRQHGVPTGTDMSWSVPTGSSSTANDAGTRDRYTGLLHRGDGSAAADSLRAGGGSFVHTRDNSLGFTFSGKPTDVVRFRSCIPPNLTRDRGGGSGEAMPPPGQSGPFPADILNVVLLFVDADSMNDILEVSRVCKFWRYYGNFAPHWTYFRRKGWSSKEDGLAQYIRAIVAKPKIMTREEYFTEKRRVEEYERRDRILNRVKHVRWCVATAIMAAVMITANFVVAYTLGFLRTALRSDAKLGATTAVMMTVMTLIEVMVVMIPLGGVSSPSSKDGMIRILCWGLVILDVGLVLGTITALAFTRVQANGHVLDGPTMDFSMAAECDVYPSKDYPSFALLPAFLWDIRWRPITTDPLGETFTPYCRKKPHDEKNETTQCYVLLFFDAEYASDVFRNKSMLDRYKNVGATTALGYDPFSQGKPIQGMWCAAFDSPQVVALTTTMYARVASMRDARYPTDNDWLTPALRPQTYGIISYRCSSDINREATELPRGSTDIWYQYSPSWLQHYIPLVSTERQLRSTFQDAHDHFLNYAFRCYIISACLWGLQLLGQCIVKAAAIDVLGVTASATLILFNPLSLVVSGILCVFVENRNFMCDSGSGYGLVGAGVALLLLMATVFVVVYD